MIYTYNKKYLILSLISLILLLNISTFAQNAQEGKVADINEIQIYYEVHGNGMPLVLLHSYGASSSIWKSFIPQFEILFKVISIDMRGHGASTYSPAGFTHHQSALDIFALLDKLEITTFSAIGISSGALTLLQMATLNPSRIDKMIIIGASSYFPNSAREVLAKNTIDNMSDADWYRMRQFAKHGDEQIKWLQNQLVNFKDSYNDVNFTPPYLSLISAKTLIVHGDRDPLFPVDIAFDIYKAIPNSYLWIIPNGAHIPIYKYPEIFTQWSLDFLQNK
ncbi:MAG: alpha/beta hydrolase [Melioribacteraceae bacterium]|nr:alpha/beta hydrolase [Melioribacteraceae bacterium]